MHKIKENSWIYYMGLFFIFPFLSLFIALRNPNDKFSYNIIWFFTFFFGLTFAINYDATNDMVRYLQEFNLWKGEGRGMGYLIENSYGVERTSYKDIFFPFISFVSSKLELTDVLFLGILGFIFGYFYSRIYKNLMENITFYKPSLFLIILICTYMLVIPMWRGINGIRFSLAAIIFIYTLLKDYNKSLSLTSLLIISSLILIHFSMLFPIILFLLFHFFHKLLPIKVLFLIFLISFFITTVSLNELNFLIQDILPEFLHSKSDTYLRDSYLIEIAERSADTNLYALIFLKSLFYATSIMIFFIFFHYRKLIRYNPRLSYIIKFSFLFAAIINILSFIPSFNRMGLISNTIVLYIFMVAISNISVQKRYFSISKIILTPMLLLYVIVQMRIGFDHMSIETVIGNPFVALFDLDNTPLIDLIK